MSGSLLEYQRSVWKLFSSEKLSIPSIVKAIAKCKGRDEYLFGFFLQSLYSGKLFEKCLEAMNCMVKELQFEGGKSLENTADATVCLVLESLVQMERWEEMREVTQKFRSLNVLGRSSYVLFMGKYWRHELRYTGIYFFSKCTTLPLARIYAKTFVFMTSLIKDI